MFLYAITISDYIPTTMILHHLKLDIHSENSEQSIAKMLDQYNLVFYNYILTCFLLIDLKT